MPFRRFRPAPIFLALAFVLLAVPVHAEPPFQPGYVLVAQSAPDFDQARDIALSPDAGYLLVAEAGRNAIALVDAMSLKLLARFGGKELSSPHDVTFLNRDTLLVADTGNDRIAVFDFKGMDAEGRPRATFRTAWTERVKGPEGVGVSPDGTHVYVTNKADDSVLRLDAKGAVINRVGGYSRAAMVDFRRPHDVAVHPDGRVFVADTGNDRVVMMTPDLTFLNVTRRDRHALSDPKDLAFGTDGDVLLSDAGNDRVLWMDRFLAIKGIIGSGKRGDAPGQLNRPNGVATLDKRIWIADTGNGRILLLRRTD